MYVLMISYQILFCMYVLYIIMYLLTKQYIYRCNVYTCLISRH